VTPVRKRKQNDITYLNSNMIDQSKKPRLSDGRTSRRAPQSHVSVTVRFDPLDNLRAKRKEDCLTNCWIDNGTQDKKNIQQVRRGDIAMTLQDNVSARGLTGLTNSAVVFTHLNNWPKNIKIRVVGIVENPSQHRGQSDGQDNFGNIMSRGVNSIVNQGKYMLCCGDHVYALFVPETIVLNGTTWSMNAIKGTGDGNGSHADYNQKLVPQLIPLKHKDIKLTLDTIRHEMDGLIVQVWEKQTLNQSVYDGWASNMTDLNTRLHSETTYLIPGSEMFCMLYYIDKSLERAMNDLMNNIDKVQTIKLIEVIYQQGHKEMREYWTSVEKEFAALSNVDDLRRLGRGTGEWLVPTGVLEIHNRIKRDVNVTLDLQTLSNPIVHPPNETILNQIEKSKDNAFSFISQLRQALHYTCAWIESNDMTQFLENNYVGYVTSAQAPSGHQFDFVR